MLRIAEITARHQVSAPFKGESSPEKQYNIVREDRAFLLSEIERLRDALKPFASVADDYDDREDSGFEVLADMDVLAPKLLLLHFRDARSALSQTEK